MIFAPSSWHRISKILGIFWVIEMWRAPFNHIWVYVKEVTFGRWRLVARGINFLIKQFELSAPPPDLRGGKKDWKFELSHTGQWFNQSRLYTGAFIKTLNDGVQRASRYMNTSRWLLGEWHAQRGHWSSTLLPKNLVQCISSIWVLLHCILYNKPVTGSKVLSWVL